MKRAIKVALAVTATVVGVLAAGIGLLVYVFASMCANEPIAEYVSPDARAKLVVFQRDCGATTGFSTQASLLKRGARFPSGSGNLFVADTDHGAAPSGPGGGPELRVHWEGPQRLLLRHHSKARVFVADRHRDGIEVRYETFP
jgi:hypothetical protein